MKRHRWVYRTLIVAGIGCAGLLVVSEIVAFKKDPSAFHSFELTEDITVGLCYGFAQVSFQDTVGKGVPDLMPHYGQFALWRQCTDHYRRRRPQPGDRSMRWRWHGRRTKPNGTGDAYIIDHYQFPLWIPALTCLIPGLLLWGMSRRHLEGHCQSCGYNFTGNKSGVCPECGKDVNPPPTKQSDQPPR